MTEKKKGENKVTTGKEAPRVGVFVCHCGKNIGGFIDVPGVTEYAKTLPNVVYAENNLYTCSEDGLRSIKENIKKHNLNRVIVASCTPRTHAPLFQSACEEAGVNKYLFEFVNIRDQCSWVHMKEKERGTKKAKDLIRMGVAKASLLEPLKDTQMDVVPIAVVLGGGIAGMTAALNLANQGMEVHLVEKTDKLGGMLRRLDTVYPTDGKAQELIAPVIKQVETHKKIKLHMSSTLEDLKGYIGHFIITVGGKEMEVGTIVVATGAGVLKPDGLYGYGKFPNVVTQLEFEDLVKSGKKVPKRVAFIQCAGSRSKDSTWRPYCSKVCCMVAVKNAKKIKAMAPDTAVYVLHRDINATGTEKEVYYHNVRGLNVKFLRYSLDSPPEIIGDKEAKTIRVRHETLGTTFEIPVDLVVLSTPMVPNPDNTTLNKMLKVPLDKEGFFLEAHVKLRPLEFATDGIFICGTARFPVGINEAVADALGAAAKAAIPMRRGMMQVAATTACVDPEKCSGCGNCEKVCPFTAIRLVEKEEGKKLAEVNALLCKGCGTCVPACPSRAISQRGFTDEQLVSQVLAATCEDQTGVTTAAAGWDPNIVGFCCNWCSYAGADMAGVSRFQYPTNLRIIRTMCSGRVDPLWILRAFLDGADGVFVSGCHPGDCHYSTGNNFTADRMKRLKETLEDYGVDGRRLRLEWVSASEGNRFAEVVKEFTEEIRALGPSPLKQVNGRRSECVEET